MEMELFYLVNRFSPRPEIFNRFQKFIAPVTWNDPAMSSCRHLKLILNTKAFSSVVYHQSFSLNDFFFQLRVQSEWKSESLYQGPIVMFPPS